MTTKQRFSSKDPATAVPLTYDFTNGLSPIETLTGSPTIKVSVTYGTDPNASQLTIGAVGFDVAGKKVYVPVSGGLDNVDYDIVVEVATTNPQKFFVLGCILPVRVQ